MITAIGLSLDRDELGERSQELRERLADGAACLML